MPTLDAASLLMPFGFTGLESEIYAFLLGESPATGYRIAQGINKPVANTYKAIQTLQAKGAVVVEDGDARQVQAVPSDELLDRLGREFESRRKAAKERLAKLGRPEMDERIYHLRSQAQTVQRAREMLAQAEVTILMSARRALVEELAGALTDAAARGVETLVKTDGELTISRVESYTARDEDLLRSLDLVKLVVDGSQHLVGLVDQAVYSQNVPLSLAHHEGLAAELSLLAVAERIEDGAGPKRLARALVQAPPARRTPGAASL